MMAGEIDALVTCAFGIFDRAVQTRGVVASLEMVSAEYVLKRAGITLSPRRHAEADVLGEQAGGDTDRERGHILKP